MTGNGITFVWRGHPKVEKSIFIMKNLNLKDVDFPREKKSLVRKTVIFQIFY